MTDRILDQKTLKELLHYDPETGIFTWLYRDRKYFDSTAIQTTWNKRFAGEKAGVMTRGYCLISIFYKKIFAHRLAFLYVTGSLPKQEVDHINGDRGKNSWSNLRDASSSENSRNMKLICTNKSGVMGVRWCEDRSKYRAYIKLKGKTKYLGKTKDFFEAVCMRKSAELRYNFHPNHGRPN